MKTLAEFIKTTLIGGLLIILPLYVSVLLLLKAVAGVLALVRPITALIPVSAQFHDLLGVLLIVIVCLLAGLAIRTDPGLRVKKCI